MGHKCQNFPLMARWADSGGIAVHSTLYIYSPRFLPKVLTRILTAEIVGVTRSLAF